MGALAVKASTTNDTIEISPQVSAAVDEVRRLAARACGRFGDSSFLTTKSLDDASKALSELVDKSIRLQRLFDSVLAGDA